MLTPHGNFAAAVPGGYDVTGRAEKYDAKTEQWTTQADMLLGRSATGATQGKACPLAPLRSPPLQPPRVGGGGGGARGGGINLTAFCQFRPGIRAYLRKWWLTVSNKHFVKCAV